MANPIFESLNYRRDLGEARDLETRLRQRFFEEAQARVIAAGAQLDVTQIDLTGAPSTFWAAILDAAAAQRAIEALLDSVERNLRPAPKDSELRTTIDRVRQVARAGGSLSPTRLLLSGDRPFLGRATLRGFVPELRNWNSAASILVVRGDPDSGRTETQLLLDEGRDRAREKFVLLNEQLPFDSSVRAVWRAAVGPTATPPALGQEALTTESATLIDFWTDVKEALDDSDRYLWVLVDDLDKGAGRKTVRLLAEVLAIRLRDVSFQRRIRLAMLGYPDDQLPAKVAPALVRNDKTEKVNDADVQAFLNYCMNAAGKNFSPESLVPIATDICGKAQAKTNEHKPYLEALNDELVAWYRTL